MSVRFYAQYHLDRRVLTCEITLESEEYAGPHSQWSTPKIF